MTDCTILTDPWKVNQISAAVASADKRWLVTADSGHHDSTIIVWDTTKAMAVKTIFNPHQGKGVLAMDMSADSKYLVTVGAAGLTL
jgi:WD40 repeat protein